MTIVRIINEAMAGSTAQKAAMAMLEALSRCDDVTLLSMLLEDEGDKETFKAELQKYLKANKPKFVDRVFTIFRTLLKAKTLEDTLAKIKARPALVRAADYVLTLYDEYASSNDLLNKVAMTKGDLNEIRAAIPELPSKDVGLPKEFIDAMTSTVTRDIERFSMDFVDGPGRPLLVNSYKWTDSDEVTDDDIEAAAGEPPVASDVRPVSEKPADLVTQYLQQVKILTNQATPPTASVAASIYYSLKKTGALDAASEQYKNALYDTIKGLSTIGGVAVPPRVYKYQGSQPPQIYNVSDIVKENLDPRTIKDPSWAQNTILGARPYGPFYSLSDMLAWYAQANSSADVSGRSRQRAIWVAISALTRLASTVENDAKAIKADKVNLG